MSETGLSNHVPIDEVWFQMAEKISVKFDKLLSPDAIEDEKNQSWLAGTTMVVPITYGALESASLDRVAEKLQVLHSAVEQNGDSVPEAAVRLWREKIRDLMSRVSLLKELQSIVSRTDPDPVQVAQLQKSLNEIFEVPTRELFTLTLSELQHRLKRKGKTDLITDEDISGFSSLPDYETLVTAYPRTVFPLPSAGSVTSPLSVEELRESMVAELERIGLATTWTVNVDTSLKYHRVLVFYKKRIIILPSTEAFIKNKIAYSVTGRKAARLLVHEISTHVVRSTNGFKSRLKLLSIGLDRYTKGEEGVATFREQQLLGGGYYFAGFESYLAIGLAYGLDRNQVVRTPQELYRLLVKINLVLHGNNRIHAEYRAWKRILRTYFVTSQSGVFLVNPKDIVYRMGNTAIQALFTSGHYDDARIDVGMYDPSNASHVALLRELQILS
jgi:hypothetical protein